MILVTGSAFSSSHGLLAPRPSSACRGDRAGRRTRPSPRTPAWCTSPPARSRRAPTGAGAARLVEHAAALERRTPELVGVGLLALGGQRLPAASGDAPPTMASVNLASGAARPSWPPASSTSPAARVLNTGSMTGCIRLRTPARGARSSHARARGAAGSSRSHSAAVSSRNIEVETLNGTFSQPVGEARRLGQRVRPGWPRARAAPTIWPPSIAAPSSRQRGIAVAGGEVGAEAAPSDRRCRRRS